MHALGEARAQGPAAVRKAAGRRDVGAGDPGPQLGHSAVLSRGSHSRVVSSSYASGRRFLSANHGFSRARSISSGSRSTPIQPVAAAELRPGDHRPVGCEHVGAPDVRAVPVEPDHVREDGEDTVVAGQEVVQARRARPLLEQLLLGAPDVLLGQLALAPVEGEHAAAGRHRPVRVWEQDHLGTLEGEDPPALEEVAVVADRGADGAEAEVEDAPLVGLPEAEELVVGGVHLALQPDQAVRPDERRRVVVRAAKAARRSRTRRRSRTCAPARGSPGRCARRAAPRSGSPPGCRCCP